MKLEKMMNEQNENTNKKEETIKKEPNRNSEPEEYNNWIEKSSRGEQQQIWSIIRKNQWTWKQVICKYPNRGAK